MEILPPDLWKTIFGFVPAHLFAARCTCQAWRAFCGKGSAKITYQTILEQRDGSEWIKKACADWWTRETTHGLLTHASTVGDIRGMELAKAWGATKFDKVLPFAAENGQLEAMELLVSPGWGATRLDVEPGCTGQLKTIKTIWLNLALGPAAEGGQLEAMRLLEKWGATGFIPALRHAAEKGHHWAIKLIEDMETPD